MADSHKVFSTFVKIPRPHRTHLDCRGTPRGPRTQRPSSHVNRSPTGPLHQTVKGSSFTDRPRPPLGQRADLRSQIGLVLNSVSGQVFVRHHETGDLRSVTGPFTTQLTGPSSVTGTDPQSRMAPSLSMPTAHSEFRIRTTSYLTRYIRRRFLFTLKILVEKKAKLLMQEAQPVQ